MQPFFAPGKSVEETQALLNTWVAQLEKLNITVTPNTTHYDNFYDAWSASFPLEAMSSPNTGTGSRLSPRANWEDRYKLDATYAAWRKSGDQGYTLISFNMAPTLARGGNPDNSVNTAWRQTVMHSIQNILWPVNSTVDQTKEYRYNLTHVDTQRLRDVTPGSGAYLGEAGRDEPNSQQSFFGDNYDRLLSIKKDVDPWDVFWAKTAVGSEGWNVVTENGLSTEGGRLCRA